MSKELLHTDSLDDLIAPTPITSVPPSNDRALFIYRKLGWLYAVEDKLALIMRVTMFIAILSLGLLMAAQVFMRYVVSSPFLGIEELAPMLALWIYFIGMAYCTRERDHIEGGVLVLMTKNPRILLSVRLFGTVISMLAVLVFIYFALDYTAHNISLNRRSTYMRFPKYIWDFSMISGFALMVFYLALQAFVEARALLTGQGEK